jgi:hypothetical protein
MSSPPPRSIKTVVSIQKITPLKVYDVHALSSGKDLAFLEKSILVAMLEMGLLQI